MSYFPFTATFDLFSVTLLNNIYFFHKKHTDHQPLNNSVIRFNFSVWKVSNKQNSIWLG